MTTLKARRLPVHRGPAAWSAIRTGQPVRVPLDGDRVADVVIVGAGFAGLEVGRLAEGASGRNSGFMVDLAHELQSDVYSGGGNNRAVIARNRNAIAFACNAVAEFGIDPN